MFQITAIYAGLAALLFTWLSLRVSLIRMRKRVSYGDGRDRALGRAIRMQGNSAEYLPLGLILVGLTEAQGASAGVVHLLGLLLLGGRVAYLTGYGRERQILLLRQSGMLATYLQLALGGVAVLLYALL
ncbi:MAPEG family protein [Aliiroseovarius sp.]|uniref:MAPEG family protein n=1 Tax=Aliiroseovarius sp. TaxID=1872442 RepID=UPI0026046019|nr:MAPEG family protein [Aliiroseovarius sp.]